MNEVYTDLEENNDQIHWESLKDMLSWIESEDFNKKDLISGIENTLTRNLEIKEIKPATYY